MTASVAALLQPIKDRLNAATPGPWECDGFAGEGVIDLSIFKGSNQGPTVVEGIKRHEDAVFFMNAPTDQAKLIAAVEAVEALAEYWESTPALRNGPAAKDLRAALTSALESAA